MARLSLGGLNVRLLLLTLLAMLPAVGLLVYNAAAERQRAADAVRADTERLARLTAAQVGQLIEGQRQLVVALASLEPVINRDPAGCARVFAQLIEQYPFYSSLGAAAPDGAVFCSSVPLTEAPSVADRVWFQRALSTGQFALGDYQQGRLTGADVIVGAYPAYTAAGELSAIVSVALNLTWFDQILANAQLPAGAAVNITDHAGTLLSRYPDPAAWVGQSLANPAMLEHMLGGTPHTVELAGLDGVQRLYAFQHVAVDSAGQLHVVVGIPTDLAFAPAEAALTRNLAAVGLAGLVAIVLARAAAEALVLRRTRSLAALTQRLAAGDLQARAGGPYGAGELDALARAFDQMAAALETREAELRQAVSSLETLSACNQALVRAPDQAALLNDICRSLVEIGGYHLAWVALPEAGDSGGPARLRVAAFASEDPQAGRQYLDGLDLTLVGAGPRRTPAEAALTSGQPVLTVHRHADAKGAPWHSQALALGWHASLALPIVVDGQPEGALVIFAAKANAFGGRAARLLEEMAGDVAFGLHTLRGRAARRAAEAQLRRHAEEAGTLAEISRDLVAVTTDEARVLEVIARRVSERLGGFCVLRLLSDDGQWLLPAAIHHPDPATLDAVRPVLASPQPAGEGAAARVLGEGETLRLENVTPEQGRALTRPEIWPFIDRLGVHSVIFTPLRTATHTLGVLNVVRAAGRPGYTADDQAFVQELAHRAALSLSNARLFHSLQRLNSELEARVAERTAALQRSAVEYADLYDNAPCGYHSLDAAGCFVRANQYELDLLGYTRDELLGLNFGALLTPASLADFPANHARFMETGRATNREYELVSRDGRVIPVLLSATAVYAPDGQFLHSRATILDIAHLKQAEAKIQALNAELAQRARQLEAANQELQAFSYSVSHDLRAPLRSIDGFSLALLEDYGPQLDTTAGDYLGRIRAAAQRMGELIDALLVLSRVTRAELRRVPVDLSHLAEAVLADLRQREPARAVTAHVAPGLAAQGDPSLLRNVLENLIGNAWKFTAGCQPARIEVGRLPDLADDGPVYFVRDNGAGFDMAYADRLFGAFQRLHDQRDFKGTGIGLATVQRIVVRHGGRVWGEGQAGRGAVFYFTLP